MHTAICQHCQRPVRQQPVVDSFNACNRRGQTSINTAERVHVAWQTTCQLAKTYVDWQTQMAMGQNPVPPVNIPIPSKIGSKMGEFTSFDPQPNLETTLSTHTHTHTHSEGQTEAAPILLPPASCQLAMNYPVLVLPFGCLKKRDPFGWR